MLFFDPLLNLLFPRFCAGCGQEGEAWCPVCAKAHVWNRPEPACPFCHAPGSNATCASCKPEAFLDGVSPGCAYADPAVRAAIGAWKYHGDQAYGEAALGFLRQGLAARPLAFTPDAVCAVPLHASRRRSRGFDQADTIARAVADEFSVPYRPLLSRVRATAQQATRAHGERLVGDLDGIFAASPDVPARVILCDDVFTSGATMDAAAKCLKEAGAKEVWGIVIARANA